MLKSIENNKLYQFSKKFKLEKFSSGELSIKQKERPKSLFDTTILFFVFKYHEKYAGVERYREQYPCH